MPSPPPEPRAPVPAPDAERELTFDWWRLREAGRLELRAERLHAAGDLLSEAHRKGSRAARIGCLVGVLSFAAMWILAVVLSHTRGLNPLALLLALGMALGWSTLFVVLPLCYLLGYAGNRFKEAARSVEWKARALREEHARLHTTDADTAHRTP